MATNSSNALTTSAVITNAEFRQLCSFFADVLQSGGVTKTADTGQIDLTTVNYPGSNNTSAGYEIRAFTDAMQGTAPVYIKIEYYRGTQSPYITLRLTIGTGSDGAGTITGVKFTSIATAGHPLFVHGSNTTFTAYVSAGTNRFSFFAISASNQSVQLSLERTIDSARAVTSTGLLLVANNVLISGAGQLESRVIVFSGTQPATECPSSSFHSGCFPPTQQTTGANAGGNTSIYPMFFYGIGDVKYPGLNWVCCFHSDFTNLSSYTVSLLGTNQTMVKVSSSTVYRPSRGDLPANSVVTWMMRYE